MQATAVPTGNVPFVALFLLAAPTLFAMVVNAAIFGGLSAPSERYRARVAWIPVLFALIWAQTHLRRPARAPQTETKTA